MDIFQAPAAEDSLDPAQRPSYHLPSTAQSREAVYQGITYFAQMIAAIPFSALYALIHGSDYITQFLHRYNWYRHIVPPTAAKQHLVFYCHSIGELRTAVPLITALRQRHPEWEFSLLVKAFEPYIAVRQLLPDITRVLFVPLDAPVFVKHALDFLRPDTLITMENDLRYHLVAEAKRRNIATLYLGAELSQRGKPKLTPTLYREALNAVDVITVRNTQGAQTVLQAGATPERVFVSGNLRFSAIKPAHNSLNSTLEEFLNRWKTQGPIFVAGSTYAQEEEIIFTALAQVRQSFPTLRAVIAPRRTAHAADALKLARAHGFSAVLRSELSTPPHSDVDVLIIDTMGELRAVYGIADLSFIGGSLVNRGGHNIIESADQGVPMLFGEYVYTNGEFAEALMQRDCAWMVHDADEMAERINFLLQYPDFRIQAGERCRQAVHDMTGAIDICINLLESVISQRDHALGKP